MPIRLRTRPLQLPFVTESFPPEVVANGYGELSVSWEEILWAALTIGRPSIHNVFQHATSLHEALFRISLVHMALEQHGSGAKRLRRTSSFKGMDPTEKGAVNYFIGMIFCKVFSSKLLNTPWLLHLDVFRSSIPTSTLGRSRPDLIGQRSGTGDWLSFETKGRAGKPSLTDRNKAKLQATRLTSVGGSPCALHIGTFTFFKNDALNFHWIDPQTDHDRPIVIPDIHEAWGAYYQFIFALWRDRGDADQKLGSSGAVISMQDFDLKIHIHKLLVPFFLLQTWEALQKQAFDVEQILRSEGFQSDGVKIECGPSWPERRISITDAG